VRVLPQLAPEDSVSVLAIFAAKMGFGLHVYGGRYWARTSDTCVVRAPRRTATSNPHARDTDGFVDRAREFDLMPSADLLGRWQWW
jgi:hypothetical protein